MFASPVARAAHVRTPLINFLGKRVIPKNIDHTPKVHSQAPFKELPAYFFNYVPAAKKAPVQRSSIQPKAGEYFDRNELPQRFWRMKITAKEIEAIESGGAVF
ncbi:hypothetical protein BZA77DRAFT_258418 [Pyronema omphalodes]|nr:hypothetical protein BZA77DRAFT_258418 [Pyronema omphalodes]